MCNAITYPCLNFNGVTVKSKKNSSHRWLLTHVGLKLNHISKNINTKHDLKLSTYYVLL